MQNKYIYQYKDQVGNVRLAYYNNGSGTAVIDRTGDFYPFGMAFGGESTLNTFGSVTPTYLYAFQEQERQPETGWDSFKWRNYDPSMGRFFNVDPLSEKYEFWSPYTFSGNRVVDARELEGLEPNLPYKSYNEAAKNFGEQYNGMSIRMKGEIGTRFYKVNSGDATYYSYTVPISAGPGSGMVDPKLSGELPKEAIYVGDGHTHGEAGVQIPMDGGEFHDNNDMPSQQDYKLSNENKETNSDYEGDVVVTSGGYLFIYGPGTKNEGKRFVEANPTYNDLPKDTNSKTNPRNSVSPNNSPFILPIGEPEDKYPLK